MDLNYPQSYKHFNQCKEAKLFQRKTNWVFVYKTLMQRRHAKNFACWYGNRKRIGRRMISHPVQYGGWSNITENVCHLSCIIWIYQRMSIHFTYLILKSWFYIWIYVYICVCIRSIFYNKLTNIIGKSYKNITNITKNNSIVFSIINLKKVYVRRDF